jgi:putative endonuclease
MQDVGVMPLFARMMFGIVNMRARRGLSSPERDDSRVPEKRSDAASADEINLATNRAARRTGVRGETFAYWYLRTRGYVIVSRNFMVPGMKGEIDLAGYDGKVLAFIEVKTRMSDADEIAKSGDRKVLPEDAMNSSKRHSLVRVAQMFMAEWRLKNCDCRFDVLAIESQRGKTPVVRLHKDCFGISGRV